MGKGKRPVARAAAVIDTRDDKPPKYVHLGDIWRTRTGGLIFTMDAEPIAWKDPTIPRTIVIQPIDRESVIEITSPGNHKDEVDYEGDGETPF